MAGDSADPDAIVRREREIRDREARSYDSHRARDSYHRLVEDAITFGMLELGHDDVVVDVGCGTGRHLLELLRVSARVIGIDHSAEMLAIARERIDPQDAERLELYEADLRALPLEDAVADKVACFETLQHLPTQEFRLGAVRELARVLKPGGTVVVSTYCWLGHIRRQKEGFFEGGLYRFAFTARELGALLREAGFEHVEVGGAVIFPSIAERLRGSVGLQRRLAFTPIGRHLAHYLVAQAARPG